MKSAQAIVLSYLERKGQAKMKKLVRKLGRGAEPLTKGQAKEVLEALEKEGLVDLNDGVYSLPLVSNAKRSLEPQSTPQTPLPPSLHRPISPPLHPPWPL